MASLIGEILEEAGAKALEEDVSKATSKAPTSNVDKVFGAVKTVNDLDHIAKAIHDPLGEATTSIEKKTPQEKIRTKSADVATEGVFNYLHNIPLINELSDPVKEIMDDASVATYDVEKTAEGKPPDDVKEVLKDPVKAWDNFTVFDKESDIPQVEAIKNTVIYDYPVTKAERKTFKDYHEKVKLIMDEYKKRQDNLKMNPTEDTTEIDKELSKLINDEKLLKARKEHIEAFYKHYDKNVNDIVKKDKWNAHDRLVVRNKLIETTKEMKKGPNKYGFSLSKDATKIINALKDTSNTGNRGLFITPEGTIDISYGGSKLGWQNAYNRGSIPTIELHKVIESAFDTATADRMLDLDKFEGRDGYEGGIKGQDFIKVKKDIYDAERFNNAVDRYKLKHNLDNEIINFDADKNITPDEQVISEFKEPKKVKPLPKPNIDITKGLNKMSDEFNAYIPNDIRSPTLTGLSLSDVVLKAKESLIKNNKDLGLEKIDEIMNTSVNNTVFDITGNKSLPQGVKLNKSTFQQYLNENIDKELYKIQRTKKTKTSYNTETGEINPLENEPSVEKQTGTGLSDNLKQPLLEKKKPKGKEPEEIYKPKYTPPTMAGFDMPTTITRPTEPDIPAIEDDISSRRSSKLVKLDEQGEITDIDKYDELTNDEIQERLDRELEISKELEDFDAKTKEEHLEDYKKIAGESESEIDPDELDEWTKKQREEITDKVDKGWVEWAKEKGGDVWDKLKNSSVVSWLKNAGLLAGSGALIFGLEKLKELVDNDKNMPDVLKGMINTVIDNSRKEAEKFTDKQQKLLGKDFGKILDSIKNLGTTEDEKENIISLVNNPSFSSGRRNENRRALRDIDAKLQNDKTQIAKDIKAIDKKSKNFLRKNAKDEQKREQMEKQSKIEDENTKKALETGILKEKQQIPALNININNDNSREKVDSATNMASTKKKVLKINE